MLNVHVILRIIALIIPYFVVVVIIMTVFAFVSVQLSAQQQHALAIAQPSATSHWLLSAFVYVSYNIATGVSMLAILGGTVKQRTIAGTGGLLGGILLGVLIFLVNIALLQKIDVVQGTALPTLALAQHIHPIMGLCMSLLLIGKMYNTAVGTLYAFTVRLVSPHSSFYKWLVIISCMICFIASFAGFTTLVGKLYSVMGYIGFILIFAIIRSAFVKRED